MLRATAAIALFALIPSSTRAPGQERPISDSSSVIEQLLSVSAPTPPGIPDERRSANARFSWDSPPPDDAPLDVLGLYWAQIDDSIKGSASQKTRERLLEACIQKPELIPSLLKIIPQTPDAQDRIKLLYDQNAEPLGESWRDAIKKYLELNSKYFRDELVATASAAKDDKETGSVTHEEELQALARLDWQTAEPILQQFSTNLMGRRSTLAKTLLYRHYGWGNSSGTKLFRELKSTVENRAGLGYSRDIAADALLSSKWDGRDDWFLRLFRDPTLRNLQDGFYLRRPLAAVVGGTPDHWIPIVTKFVGDRDRSVHDNAVECLIQFQLRRARKDALVPLLPWLMDPKWSSASDRLASDSKRR